MNKCPRCDKPCQTSEDNQYMPFCSEKCKLIDFGSWASEKFKISTPKNKSEYDENI